MAFDPITCRGCGTMIEITDPFHDIVCSICGRVVWKVREAVKEEEDHDGRTEDHQEETFF